MEGQGGMCVCIIIFITMGIDFQIDRIMYEHPPQAWWMLRIWCILLTFLTGIIRSMKSWASSIPSLNGLTFAPIGTYANELN